MKKSIVVKKSIILFFIFLFVLPIYAESEVNDTTYYTTYEGQVVDAEDKSPLVFANITLKGTNIATVSNSEGDFVIKVSKSVKSDKLEFSYLGYTSVVVSLSELKPRGNVIKMEASTIPLSEVKIRPTDAEDLLRNVLTRIKENYSQVPNNMTAFYRETIKKRNRYVSISEAVLDIYKAPYSGTFRQDLVKISKGRKSTDVDKLDTIMFKVQGGPSSALLLDVVKNPYVLLSNEYFDSYNYNVEGLLKIDDRLTYIISFGQKMFVEEPLYYGKFYIDINSLAMIGAEFSLNLEDPHEASKLFIRKKPLFVDILPEKANYLVNYKLSEDGKWYFNYARCEVKFKCKWDKKIFNSNYTTMAEMAITDRKDKDVHKISSKERIHSRDVISEKIIFFTDKDFWGEYNTIEPEQSIESAIRKLGKKGTK